MKPPRCLAAALIVAAAASPSAQSVAQNPVETVTMEACASIKRLDLEKSLPARIVSVNERQRRAAQPVSAREYSPPDADLFSLRA
ncbi:MAG: hypothetical protein Q8N18_24460 [Opitutaceae bacterium]|nr:hypothetical protein [Opitutaceae bacterium]